MFYVEEIVTQIQITCTYNHYQVLTHKVYDIAHTLPIVCAGHIYHTKQLNCTLALSPMLGIMGCIYLQ